MTPSSRQLHFNSCIDHLDLAWRLPSDQPVRLFDFDQLAERARLAERGLMDAMFIADFYLYRPTFSLEPITLLAALATVTRHIGLIASVSTTYNEPFDLARMFASLDRLSGGRAGWNMVTTAIGAVSANYSRDEHLEHDTRYDRAHEVLQVVTGLWDGHENNIGKSRGASHNEEHKRTDPSIRQNLNHQGDWFQVKGPLDIPHPIQGQPLRVQAGSSQAGRDFGARWAEVIFTAQPVLSIAQEFYADIRERMARLGRMPSELKILPGLMLIVARTQRDADAQLAARQGNQQDTVNRLKEMLGIDFSRLPPNDPIPLDILPSRGVTNGMQGRGDLYLTMIRKHRLTPQQVLQQEAHLAFAGTPQATADFICDWFTSYACDGFTLMWPSLEANILFTEEVIPILQSHGLYRTAYPGKTLRDNFGLPHSARATPANSGEH